ncbi:MAG TPA: ABC transporter substrate-binding protein [Geminicoccaceae bacterium]
MRVAALKLVGLGLVVGLLPSGPRAAEDVTLVLNWVPGGDHAPIYWAKEQGNYADAGVDLTIEPGRGSGEAVQKVGAGAVEFGIADMATALQGRGQGADVVGVMSIYANNPYGIYWKKSSGIEDVQDLAGRKIGNPPFDAARQMWPAIADATGLEGEVEWVNIKPDAKIQSLQAGVIDATTSFYNLHYIFEQVFGDDMGFVALRDIGFNPYGNSIIVNGSFLAENPEVVDAFVKTTQQAYATCLEDPKPCNEALAAAASQKLEDVQANWDLVVELMDHPVNREEALGWFDPARMEQDLKWVAASFDIESYDVGDAYTNAHLDKSVKMTGGAGG